MHWKKFVVGICIIAIVLSNSIEARGGRSGGVIGRGGGSRTSGATNKGGGIFGILTGIASIFSNIFSISTHISSSDEEKTTTSISETFARSNNEQEDLDQYIAKYRLPAEDWRKFKYQDQLPDFFGGINLKSKSLMTMHNNRPVMIEANMQDELPRHSEGLFIKDKNDRTVETPEIAPVSRENGIQTLLNYMDELNKPLDPNESLEKFFERLTTVFSKVNNVDVFKNIGKGINIRNEENNDNNEITTTSKPRIHIDEILSKLHLK